MSHSRAEQEVRSILDEAICTSVTASNSGLSWEKLMMVIRMQRCPAEHYATQRLPKEATHEISIGDNINPFRPEILKLICAMQFIGCVSQNGVIPLSSTNIIGENSTNSKESSELYISDNTCTQLPLEEFKSKVNLKSKCNKVSTKKFVESTKQNDILYDTQYLNKFQKVTEDGNASVVQTHKEKESKMRNSEEVKIKNVAHDNEYNYYLLTRYENDYNVNKLESSRNEDSFDLDVQNKQEESQYAEYYSYMQQRNNSDYQWDYSENEQNVNTVACHSPQHTNHNTNKTEAKNKSIGDVQCSEQNTVTQDTSLKNVHEETSGNYKLPSSKTVTVETPCCNPVSTYLAKNEPDTEEKSKRILKNIPTEYLCDICHHRHTNKKCEGLIMKDSEVTAFDSILVNKEADTISKSSQTPLMFAEVTGTEFKKSDHEIGSVSGRNKVHEKSDLNDIHCLAYQTTDTSHQYPSENYNVEDNKFGIVHNFRECVNSEHPVEYLFKNFIQPEDENNIKLLLVDNFSNTHNHNNHKKLQDEMQKFSVCVHDTSETTKISHNSLNCILQTDNNSTISSESVNEIQYLHNTIMSNNDTIHDHIDKEFVKTEMEENSTERSQDKFSDKKVFWSSVGLVIEEIHDPNFLLVAGHSGELEVDPLDSKAEDECLTLLDDDIEEQLQHPRNILCTKPDRIEDLSLTVSVEVSNSTGMSSKYSNRNEKSIDKGEETKKSQNKYSFLKSLRKFLHLSRKH